ELGLPRDVDAQADRLAAGRHHKAGRLVGARGVDVAGHDPRAPSGERQRGGAADPAPCAGEDRDRTVEFEGDRHAMATAFVRTNSRRPSRPPSRPNPEMPTPPNGSSHPTTGDAPFT